MIDKVISGGQSGVDLAALDAALELGIPTGGWMPRGWLAEDGPHPERAEKYGLLQMPTASYPARTRKNVESAHATLILADVSDHSLLTGGTKLTWDIAFRCGQRGSGLYMANLDRGADFVSGCREWLEECSAAAGYFVLNVAGPRESKCSGIYALAKLFMLAVLTRGD